MAMRMPPQQAQQSFLPDVNRSSLVFFAGFILIVLNFYWVNGGAVISAIFTPGATSRLEGMSDTAFQIIGLALLTLAAEYGGDNAGTAALIFIGVLWLLWLITHFGGAPEKVAAVTETSSGTASTTTNTPTSGGSGGQFK